MRLFSQFAALSILLGGVALHADTFRYDLNFDLPGTGTALAAFTSASLITADATVPASGTSSAGSVVQVAIYALGDCPFTSAAACFSIEETGTEQNLFLLTLPNATGTFPDVFGDGTVTITSVSATSGSPVPEPSSLALLGSGVLGGLGALRRRMA